MSVQIRITLTEEIAEILSEAAGKLGKKPSTYARDLVEDQLKELSLITSRLKEK